MTRNFLCHDIPIKWHGIKDTELYFFVHFPRNHSTNCFGVKESKYGKILTWAAQGPLLEDAHAGMNFFFENYYPKQLVEGFWIKKLSLEFLIFFPRNDFFFKIKCFFEHITKLLVNLFLAVCEILKLLAENPRIPFYQFNFLYHEKWNSVFFLAFWRIFLKI